MEKDTVNEIAYVRLKFYVPKSQSLIYPPIFLDASNRTTLVSGKAF